MTPESEEGRAQKCYMCLESIDTREGAGEEESGGCQLSNGLWICSFCWDEPACEAEE